jgi:hypothetical protein
MERGRGGMSKRKKKSYARKNGKNEAIRDFAPALEPLAAAMVKDSDDYQKQIKEGAAKIGVDPRILERRVVIETAKRGAAVMLYGEEGRPEPVGIFGGGRDQG